MGRCGKCGAPIYIPRREEMPPPISNLTRFHGGKPGQGMTRTVVAVTAAVAVLAAAVGGYFLLVPRNSALGVDDRSANKVTDPFAAPQVVTVGASGSASQEGALADAKSENVFKFKAPAAGTLVVYVDPAAGSKVEGQLVALDAQRKEIARNEAEADRRVSQLQFPVTADQEYYLKVGAFEGTSGKYKVTFTHVTSVGGDFHNALELRLTRLGSGTQAGRLEPWGHEDMYRVVAPASGWMYVEMAKAPGSNLDVLLYAYDGNRLFLPRPARRWASPCNRARRITSRPAPG
jgi:hypothetical protein